jgi:hypothetical protein
MHPHPPGLGAHPGHPRRHMQPSRGTALPRGQRVSPRLLLSHSGRRRQRGRTHLRGVAILRKTHLPTHTLQTIHVTWPFAVWGLDIVGLLRNASGGYRHLLAVVDKFSNWIEARPITNLRSE